MKKRLFFNGNNHLTYDKTPVRDFIYIEDLVKIHYSIGKLIQKKNFFKMIINCGYGTGLSVLDIVNSFVSKSNLVFLTEKEEKRHLIFCIFK